MNDRAISILEKYEIEVLRHRKGRGAILCETKEGLKIFKEYAGSAYRLSTQNLLLKALKENGNTFCEQILTTKEGELSVKDDDGITYILKDYIEGKECNIREQSDIQRAVKELANLHNHMSFPMISKEYEGTTNTIAKEILKHNKELRKARKFLKCKSQKTEFELYLLKHFDCYYEKALKIEEDLQKYPFLYDVDKIKKEGHFCHGEFQHHNILFQGQSSLIINFEKFSLESQIKDLSLFLRKVLEKNGWCENLGNEVLCEYKKNREISSMEWIELYYRLLYPEKFWKIVNFYLNSGKSWIPGKNMDKLNKIIDQEEKKEAFLQKIFTL
ncbi:MAG: CotS family spore coat protein [Lachnospiraceae bacterium]